MFSEISRRRALHIGLMSAATGLLAGSIASCASTSVTEQPTTGRRRRYSAYSPEGRRMLETYARAVCRMKRWSEENAADKRGWLFQAAIHGSAFEDRLRNQCVHGNWWFLPWHRAYLWYFERIVRKAAEDDSFTLPYWPWHDVRFAMIPEAFRDPLSPLFDERADGVNDGVALPLRENVDRMRGLHSFREFGGVRSSAGVFEGDPHQPVHNLIAHNMALNECAARDPIFWLHHCNVDRLWAAFRQLHPDPEIDEWKQNLRTQLNAPMPTYFVEDDGTEAAAPVATKDFIMTAPRYDYDYVPFEGEVTFAPPPPPAPPMPPTPPTPAPAPPPDIPTEPELPQAGDQRTVLGPAPVKVILKLNDATFGQVLETLTLADRDRENSPQVQVVVRGVRMAGDPAVIFKVYVNATAFTSENYLGSISMFIDDHHAGGAHHVPGDGGKDFDFDATPVILRLRKSGGLGTSTFSFTIVPVGVRNSVPKAEVTYARVELRIVKEKQVPGN